MTDADFHVRDEWRIKQKTAAPGRTAVSLMSIHRTGQCSGGDGVSIPVVSVPLQNTPNVGLLY